MAPVPSVVPERRVPPPWSVVEENAACFIVRDANGYPLAYVYFEDEPGRRSAAHLMTRDEARRIAVNIAKLPELLRPTADDGSDELRKMIKENLRPWNGF